MCSVWSLYNPALPYGICFIMWCDTENLFLSFAYSCHWFQHEVGVKYHSLNVMCNGKLLFCFPFTPSMWWCSRTVLRPHEALWSWWFPRQHALSLPWRLCRQRLLQYWGECMFFNWSNLEQEAHTESAPAEIWFTAHCNTCYSQISVRPPSFVCACVLFSQKMFG